MGFDSEPTITFMKYYHLAAQASTIPKNLCVGWICFKACRRARISAFPPYFPNRNAALTEPRHWNLEENEADRVIGLR